MAVGSYAPQTLFVEVARPREARARKWIEGESPHFRERERPEPRVGRATGGNYPAGWEQVAHMVRSKVAVGVRWRLSSLWYNPLGMVDSVISPTVSFQAGVTPLSGGFFYDELIKSIENARLFILVAQYQWKWNIHQRHSHVQRLGAAIERARSRNVAVNVILHQESPSRHLSKINRVTGDQLARMGCQVKMYSPSVLLHAKIWVIDGRYSFIGSHNISTRSLCFNEEFSVKIDSVPVAKFVKDYFYTLWGA